MRFLAAARLLLRAMVLFVTLVSIFYQAADAHAGVGSVLSPQTTTTGVGTTGGSAKIDPETADASDNDELILEIHTEHRELSDTITGLGLRRGVYLPLGAIARLFDLPIAIGDDGHIASGWFLSPKRTLLINLKQHRLVVAGKSITLAEGDALAFEGELYLRSDRFADILPLQFKVDLRAESITVITRESFPFQQRQAREQARNRLDVQQPTGPPKLPREDTPWQALSFPIGELETRAMSDTTLGTRIENDIRLAGDIGFMTGRVFVTTASNYGIAAARVELGRHDPDATLLGPLHASDIQIGDIATDALPMGLTSSAGRGAWVSNAPLTQASVFDTINLIGELPDGYEVELYRNDVLVASSATPIDGQYRFLKVPVDFGLNIFRLEFYGPQGQRREEERRISVGDGRLAAGKLRYSVGVVQNSVDLFGIKGPEWSAPLDYGGWRAVALMQYGLTSNITEALSADWFQTDSANVWQAYEGLRTGIAGIAVKLDLGIQGGTGSSSAGRAVQFGLGGRVLGASYVFSKAWYGGGFIDEIHSPIDLPLTSATDFDLNTTLHPGGGTGALWLPVTVHYDSVAYTSGQTQTDASLRTAWPAGRFSLSGSIDYSASGNIGTPTFTTLLGAFDLASISGTHTQYHMTLAVDMLPRFDLDTVGVEADRMIGKLTTLKAGIDYAVTGSETLLDLAAQHRFAQGTMAFESLLGIPHRDYSIVLRYGFSFGRNPITGQMFLAQPGMSASGAVALRAFRDLQGSGSFAPGDTPLAGTTFNTGSQTATTDSQGIAMLRQIGDGTPTNVQIDTATLPDINLAATKPGFEIVPRAGRIHVAQVAVVALGSIEGTAWYQSTEPERANKSKRGVSGVQLWLVNRKTQARKHLRTEADGYFLFEQLSPGDYDIVLDKAQAGNLHIHLLNPIRLHLDHEGSDLRVAVRVVNDAPVQPSSVSIP